MSQSGGEPVAGTVRRRVLIAPVALGCWMAAGVLVGFPDWAWLTAVLTGLLGTVALLVSAVRRRGGVIALFAVLAATIALVALVVAMRATDRQPEQLRALADGRPVTVSAVMTSTLVARGGPAGGGRFRVELREVSSGPNEYSVTVPALVFTDATGQGNGSRNGDREADTTLRDTGIGTVIEFTGTMRVTPPGDGSAFLIFAHGPVVIRAEASGPVAWAGSLRRGLVDASLALPGAGGRLLPGLAIGDVSAVDDGLDAAMKVSSLSHLTAVSGKDFQHRSPSP